MPTLSKFAVCLSDQFLQHSPLMGQITQIVSQRLDSIEDARSVLYPSCIWRYSTTKIQMHLLVCSLQSAHTLDELYFCPGVTTTTGCTVKKSRLPFGQNEPVALQQPQKGCAVHPKCQTDSPPPPGEMQPSSPAERPPDGRREHQHHSGPVSLDAVQ